MSWKCKCVPPMVYKQLNSCEHCGANEHEALLEKIASLEERIHAKELNCADCVRTLRMQDKIQELRKVAYLENTDTPRRDAEMEALKARIGFLEEDNQRLSSTAAAHTAGAVCYKTHCDGRMLYTGGGVSRCQTCGAHWNQNN